MTGSILPRVIGHRGAAAHAPENTLAGFACAVRLGVGWIELDVQLTADGVPVVFHDDRLDRTSDGHGLLVETSLADIRRLDAGGWFAERFSGEKIPTLSEALSFLVKQGQGLCLEVKASEARGGSTARAALAEVERSWPADGPPLVISSFAKSALAVADEMAPDRPRGLLVEKVPSDWRDEVSGLGCTSLHVDQTTLDEKTVRAVKEAGLALFAYTVNDRLRAEQLWGWGADTLFSDCPEQLLSGSDG
ncbi:glycerophosphoryl diester phosphodiesterase [Telmatospirillum siberiense]|uniref:Glycerophosphoryl diester phosphodiesterase n=1 Tax=Telmatospirillum siberiense TaxID=382514 RepID=A0A2N3PSF7_9PROT|nr:glycerophosphoryl diester phosphodiesterase [Telmatospirillum siberiense]PKU23339.1 glycerophosphoryl diester phosphodiesterase [Telmatospirillum siberiense]